MDRDVVVIGGSAGALDPLKEIAAHLPADLEAAVVVCIHLAATARSALAPILSRAGGLQAVTPRDGDPLRPGYIYVLTPDHHLELSDDTIRVTRGPKVNGARPSVDVLFNSDAAAYGPRVAGVVLSGGLDDGSAGIAAVKAAGGLTIVQSPDDALLDSMPWNAIATAGPDRVLTASEIGSALVHSVRESAPREHPSEFKGGAQMELVGARDAPGQVTGMTCPDCHGSIWMRVGDGGEVTFACRIGHVFAPESFFEVQAENVESALWAAVRSLEEQASLAAVMASRAARLEDGQAAGRYRARHDIATANAETIRNVLLKRSDSVA